MTEFYVGMVHLTIGDFDSALQATDNVRLIGDRTGDKRLQAYGGFLNGWIRATLRQFELAVKILDEALATAPDPTSKSYVSAFLGYVYMENGDHQLATPLLRKAVEDFVAFQFRPFEGWFRVLLAESLRQEGETEEALVFAREGMDITREVRYAYGIGWAQRCLGRLADHSDNQEKVETYLRAAIATFEELGARFELARTLEELATVMTKRGSSAEADSLNEMSKSLNVKLV